ncbi:hypothetical protein U1Q18_022380 [Sarracenia purpurea var. burkii]
MRFGFSDLFSLVYPWFGLLDLACLVGTRLGLPNLVCLVGTRFSPPTCPLPGRLVSTEDRRALEADPSSIQKIPVLCLGPTLVVGFHQISVQYQEHPITGWKSMLQIFDMSQMWNSEEYLQAIQKLIQLKRILIIFPAKCGILRNKQYRFSHS